MTLCIFRAAPYTTNKRTNKYAQNLVYKKSQNLEKRYHLKELNNYLGRENEYNNLRGQILHRIEPGAPSELQRGRWTPHHGEEGGGHG